MGIVFSALSLVSVLAAQPSAYLADVYGKVPSLLVGTGLISMSFAIIPAMNSFEGLLFAMGPLALGSTFLSSVPTAYLSDLVPEHKRSQALALLRTAGDVGLLSGAVCSGLVSEVIGMQVRAIEDRWGSARIDGHGLSSSDQGGICVPNRFVNACSFERLISPCLCLV